MPATHDMELFGPPMQEPPEQSGQGWMPGIELLGSVDTSPVRKMTELRGRSRLVEPVLQLTVPDAVPLMELRTQTLVGVVPGFGTASGAPKRQPTPVQRRLLPPTAVEVVGPMVAVWPVQLVMAVTASP